MAGRDYISCKKCHGRIVYDGDDNGRERLEEVWGDPGAANWTVGLLCPDCAREYEEAVESAIECIRTAKYSLALKSLLRISQ